MGVATGRQKHERVIRRAEDRSRAAEMAARLNAAASAALPAAEATMEPVGQIKARCFRRFHLRGRKVAQEWLLVTAHNLGKLIRMA
ncbi:MAG: hypothetical protein R3F30_04320 [Planctomycetota bacterium]